MRKINFPYYMLIILSASVLAGCMSVPNSPNPRFYTLKSINKDQVSQKFTSAPGMVVAIGPINIPEYLNRPQMVIKNKNGTLDFAQFDRWGESIEYGLTRLLMENLSLISPDVNFQIFPCNFAIPLDYQVIVNIIQLESELDKDVFLSAQWSVIDSKKKDLVVTKISDFRNQINPHTYAGLADALSAACISLSNEIAREISLLPKQPDKKDGAKKSD